jgi:hypothetical protein
MWASMKGRLDIVRTLLECDAAVEAKDNVRNQMMMVMMMMIIMIALTIMMIVTNDEDVDDYR